MARKTAVVLMILVIGISALGVWLGSLWIEVYSNQMSELINNSPEQARTRLIGDLELLALATGAIACLLSSFLIWYGIKSLRTQSMPPKYSWVIEGQRIRTGPDAVLRAKLLLFAAAVFLLLGILAAVMLWRVPVALLTSQ